MLFGDDFALSTFGLDLGTGGGAESMGADRQFSGKLAVTENLDSVANSRAICQASRAQGICIHTRAVIETIERIKIYRQVTGGMAGIVKPALGDAPDQGHLAAFETDSNGTARAGGLAFAAASTGFAMAAGFALAEALAAVLGAGTRLEIV